MNLPNEKEALQRIIHDHLVGDDETDLRLKVRFKIPLVDALRSFSWDESQIADLMRKVGVAVDDRPNLDPERTLQAMKRHGSVVVLKTPDRRHAMASDNPFDPQVQELATELQLPLWFIGRDTLQQLQELVREGESPDKSEESPVNTSKHVTREADTDKTTGGREAVNTNQQDPISLALDSILGAGKTAQLAGEQRLGNIARKLEVDEQQLTEQLAQTLGVNFKRGFEGDTSLGKEWADQGVIASRSGDIITSNPWLLEQLINQYGSNQVSLATDRIIKGQVNRAFKEGSNQTQAPINNKPIPSQARPANTVPANTAPANPGEARPGTARPGIPPAQPSNAPRAAPSSGSPIQPMSGKQINVNPIASRPQNGNANGPNPIPQASGKPVQRPPTASKGPHKARRLGDILLEEGEITEDKVGLSDADLRQLVKSEEKYYRAIAKLAQRGFVDPEADPPEESARGAMPSTTIQQHRVYPYRIEGRYLLVLMADPRALPTLRSVQNGVRGYTVTPVVATPSSINRLISSTIERAGALQKLNEENLTRGRNQAAEEEDSSTDSGVIKMVNQILSEAIDSSVNDIHIESKAHAVLVKYRIDGKLRQAMEDLAPQASRYLIARIKTMAQMDSSINKRPLDGRLVFSHRGQDYEFRVATIPINLGKNMAEKAVLRLLARGNVPKVENLGFTETNLQALLRMGNRPNGILLVTGPTGSGKTTTCNSLLSTIAVPEKNTVSIEDPVEYEISHINQTQVNKAQGLDFATALRSFLRLDPDIIFVGEIRDRETAQVATEAAITGHLVIATLHANDAPGTVVRLVEMGIETFNLSGSMIGAIGQRLVRKLCPDCKDIDLIKPDAAEILGWPTDTQVWSPRGCPKCGHTGYRGRIAIHEVMEINDVLRTAITEGVHHSALRELALENGMISMRDDGLMKANEGITSIYEVINETRE